MAAKKQTTSKDPTYAEATTELQEILDEIEDGSADIDELSAKVERAADLIRLCRDKLGRTELKVQKVVEDLGKDLGDAAGGDED